FDTSVVASAFRAVALSSDEVHLAVLGAAAVDDREIDVVSALRARWPQAFVLVLFPAALRERAARALELGADASLPEPFYPGELASIARRVAALAQGGTAQRATKPPELAPEPSARSRRESAIEQ